MDDRQPGYYSVTPARVRYCKALPFGARLLYGEISALTTLEGYCWATNRYFAELYDVGQKRIGEWIGLLERSGFIRLTFGEDGSAEQQRRIYLAEAAAGAGEPQADPPPEKDGTPPVKLRGAPPENYGGMINTGSTTQTKKIFPEDSFEHEAALYLLELMKGNDPGTREPDLQSWASHIDRLRRIDRRTEEEILGVIAWSQQDRFWKTNILSTKKLREQFQKLLLQMKEHQHGRKDSGYKGFDRNKYPSLQG